MFCIIRNIIRIPSLVSMISTSTLIIWFKKVFPFSLEIILIDVSAQEVMCAVPRIYIMIQFFLASVRSENESAAYFQNS